MNLASRLQRVDDKLRVAQQSDRSMIYPTTPIRIDIQQVKRDHETYNYLGRSEPLNDRAGIVIQCVRLLDSEEGRASNMASRMAIRQAIEALIA